MADPGAATQEWFNGLSFKVKKKLAVTIKAEADRLAAAIKDAAPVKSGTLRDSVKVRRKKSDVDLEVTAGGDTTTKEVRAGSSTHYDYSLAVELGTVNSEAQPFFWPTYRAMAPEIRQNIEDAISEAVSS